MLNKNLTCRRSFRLFGYIFGAMPLCIHLMSAVALAGDAAQFRPTYDKIMMLINFCILAFVIIKYGKTPFMNFLQGRTDEVAKEIHRLQKQKNAIDAKISKTNQMIEDSSKKFEKLKARIIKEGERAKQKIIDDAKAQSKKIIELEKLKAENRIVQARNQFMAELVDAASMLAQKRLPDEITNQDHQQLLDLFLSNITHATDQTA